MKYLLCLACFLVTGATVFAQGYILPQMTPSAMLEGGSKGGGTDVDLYSGHVNISVPIYTMTDGSVSAQIGLQYSGCGGIRVEDIASNVGLGWSLLAGGFITRELNGHKDDSIFGYANQAGAGIGAFYNEDLAPDAYYSSIGGRIIIDYNNEAMFTDQKGYKVVQNGMFGNDGTWIILDQRGTQYIFGSIAMAREYQSDRITTWALTQIVAVDGSRITFTYEKGSSVGYTYKSAHKTIKTTNGSISPNPEYTDKSTIVVVNDPVRLVEISTTNSRATLTYENRIDVPNSKVLTGVTIYDKISGASVGSYRLNRGYFKDADGNANARLKLSGIDQYSADGKQIWPIAKFTYNETVNLPPRSSWEMDHWGYYNSNPGNKKFRSEGAIRKADEMRCQANMLASIEWRYGAKTQYNYEINQYMQNGVLHKGGGLRIRSINALQDGKTTTTSYSYLKDDNSCSGLLNSQFNEDYNYSFTSYNTYELISQSIIRDQLVTEFSNPISALTDVGNIGVGYSRVVVTADGGAREEFKYSDYADFPDVPDALYEGGQPRTYDPNTHMFLTSFTSKASRRGLLKERLEKDAAGRLVKKTIDEYGFAEGKTVNAAQRALYFSSNINNVRTLLMWAGVYREIATSVQLYKSTVTNYDINNSNSGHTETLTYAYNPDYPWMVKTIATTQTTNRDIYTKKYLYAQDAALAQLPIAQQMVNLNIQTPLETTYYERLAAGSVEYVTGSDLLTYSSFSSVVLPSATYRLRLTEPVTNFQPLKNDGTIDTRYRLTGSYVGYAGGHPQSYKFEDGIPRTTLWGYGNEYPVAEVLNAYSPEIIYANFENFGIDDDNDDKLGAFNASTQTVFDPLDPAVGKYSLKLTGSSLRPNTFTTKNLSVDPAKKYILTFWQKLYGYALNISATGSQTVYDKITETKNGVWQHREICLTNLTSNITFRSEIGSIWIDDVKFYPFNARIVTYGYKNLVGETHMEDINQKITTYEYDAFNQLIATRDSKGNIVTAKTYSLTTNSGWVNTGVKSCVAGNNGLPTGEQALEQQDVAPLSPTYNQKRWLNIGFSDDCAQ